MLMKLAIIYIIVLLPICFTDVAPKMIIFKMKEKGVFVQESLITKLAEWMTFMRIITRVTITTMLSKLLSSVQLVLTWKQLQIIKTDITKETVVNFPNMVL